MEGARIFKYQIKYGINVIRMAAGARIISCGAIGNEFFIWAIVYPNRDEQDYYVNVFHTGEQLPDNIHLKTHIGTIVLGSYVLHVFWNIGIPKSSI